MGIEQTMDLVQTKYKYARRQKNHGNWANSKYEISNEIKDMRQKKGGGSRTMDLDLLKK